MSDDYGAYGNHKWTCGECGESYEASGVVGDSKVDRWRARHKEEHRVEKMTPDERLEHYHLKDAAFAFHLEMRAKAERDLADVPYPTRQERR